MNENRLSISTKKSLFSPIEVEIDGKVFIIEKLPAPIFDKLLEMEKTLKGPEDLAFFRVLADEVQLLTGADRETVDQIDFRDLKQVVQFVLRKAGEIYTQGPEKKESGPEAIPSA